MYSKIVFHPNMIISMNLTSEGVCRVHVCAHVFIYLKTLQCKNNGRQRCTLEDSYVE